MKEIVFTKNYEVNSVNINMNKRLGLFGMLGMLQDIGTIHAGRLGVGYEQMKKDNAFWVYVQQKLKMQRWPEWQDTVTVKTWPRAIQGIKAYRDFAIYIGEERIGESVGTFMVLNGETRRPTQPKLPEEIHQNVPKDILDFIPKKIQLPENLELSNTITVRNSDLDMNNHVNNTKYAQWVLDSIPIKYHRMFVVKEFDVNFIAETKLGDVIDVHLMIDDDTKEEVPSFYQGIRRSDGKTVFTSHIIGRRI